MNFENIFKIYQVYYLDNGRQKIIIATGLLYFQAVKLIQQQYNNSLSCEYEINCRNSLSQS